QEKHADCVEAQRDQQRFAQARRFQCGGVEEGRPAGQVQAGLVAPEQHRQHGGCGERQPRPQRPSGFAAFNQRHD
nr:hypothetical protein [Tanacetum cinerariifolium]